MVHFACPTISSVPHCCTVSTVHHLSQFVLKKEPFHYNEKSPAQNFANHFFFFLIYLWLCWVFVSVRGLSLVVPSGGHSSSRCAGLSLSRPLLLRSTGNRRAGSAIVAHGPSRSAACGIFPDQGSNPCPLHWQADSQPLCHQGSPCKPLLIRSISHSTFSLHCTNLFVHFSCIFTFP